MLVDGQWVKTPVTQGAQADEGGRFVRRPSAFRGVIAAEDAARPEPGRYHLYVSWACPWAHRTLIVRKLKGLEDVVGLSAVDYLMGDEGWVFSERRGAIPDTVHGARFLRELYVRADPRYTGKVTVPVLWDRRAQTIVNNESLDIAKMLDQAFPAAPGAPELYPEALRAEIDAMIAANYEPVNNGVYRAGFARSQSAYDEAVTDVFSRLDALDAHLSTRRFLLGPRLTLADVTLFTTLVRFDAVYVGHFKCNLRRIADYANLSGYLRDLYQWPGIASTVDFEHIKGHYFSSHETINPSRIVPKGPVLDLDAPPMRAHLGER
ncbi:glutathione S-transferase family protein [Myxococcota bacterium]|nr:glutathione S-transferase family protein [Myxococcota bacterium]